MSDRPTDKRLEQWREMTPEDVWAEMRRARASEEALLRKVKERDKELQALAESIVELTKMLEDIRALIGELADSPRGQS